VGSATTVGEDLRAMATIAPEMSLKTAALVAAAVGGIGFLNLVIIQLDSQASGAAVIAQAEGPAGTTPIEEIGVVVDVTVPLAAAQTAGESDPDAEAPGPAVAPSDTTVPRSTPAPRAPAAPAPSAAPQPPQAAPPTAAVPPTTPVGGAPTPTAPATTIPQPTTTLPAVTTQYEFFTFAGVASSIVIAHHDGGSLEFWSAIPEAGWAYVVENPTGSELEIKFRHTQTENEAVFKAHLDGGTISIERES